MNITFTAKAATGKAKNKHAIVVALSSNKKLGSAASEIDRKAKGAIGRAIKASKFEGKLGDVESITGVDGVAADRIVVVGLGDEKKIDEQTYFKAGGHIVAHLNAHQVGSAEVHLDAVKGKLSLAQAAAQAAFGARLRSYSFVKYHTKRVDELKMYVSEASFVLKEAAVANKAYGDLEKIAQGIEFTRDLVTEPSNVIYPESYAKECKALTKLGVKVEVLSKAQMEKLGMGALLGVAQGSVHEAKMVVMQWNGGKKSQKPVAFVGKGVTFDTGGISIKPSANMEDMKYDMGGSAVVVGLMKALAGRKAKVNAIGVIGLVENMPDGNAQRPGDVVKTMSGQTVEVINTDAEGRLVLADALWYTQDRFKPQFMVDLATLTGAILVAIGDSRAGLFSNNDTLANRIHECGEKVGERVWRFPVGEEYEEQINSDIADMKNVGAGRGAGSITAAEFLRRYVNDVPWAHLDIAGVTWSGKGNPSAPKGATGYGVRLLNQLVADYYEK